MMRTTDYFAHLSANYTDNTRLYLLKWCISVRWAHSGLFTEDLDKLQQL